MENIKHYDSNMAAELVSTSRNSSDDGISSQVPWRMLEEKIDAILKILMMGTGGNGKKERKFREEKDSEDVHNEWDNLSLHAAVEKQKMIGGYVRSWRADKGFGFMSVDGKDVFVHVTSLRSSEVGIVGKRVVANIIQDVAKGNDTYRAVKTYTESDYLEMKAAERAEKAADEAVKAAEHAKQKAELSVRALENAMKASIIAKVSRPPGLGVALITPSTEPVVERTGVVAEADTATTVVATSTAVATATLTAARSSAPMSTAAKTRRNEIELEKAMELYTKKGGNNVDTMTKKLTNSKPWEVKQWCEKWLKEIAKKEADDRWMEKAKVVHDWAHEKKHEKHKSWDDFLKRYTGWEEHGGEWMYRRTCDLAGLDYEQALKEKAVKASKAETMEKAKFICEVYVRREKRWAMFSSPYEGVVRELREE
jgi:cold shock CspA family protein